MVATQETGDVPDPRPTRTAETEIHLRRLGRVFSECARRLLGEVR